MTANKGPSGWERVQSRRRKGRSPTEIAALDSGDAISEGIWQLIREHDQRARFSYLKGAEIAEVARSLIDGCDDLKDKIVAMVTEWEEKGGAR